jgi:type IV secretory pathway component VirB8
MRARDRYVFRLALVALAIAVLAVLVVTGVVKGPR